MVETRVLRNIYLDLNGSNRKLKKNSTISFRTWYTTPNIIRAMKSRKMEWIGHVAYTGEEKCTDDFGKETRRKETTWKS